MRYAALTTAALTVAQAGLTAAQAGMYGKNSNVIQVSSLKDINRSQYTWIVEFYAPWCGHCQALKDKYETVATKLTGLAKVAAVDCDDDANKKICTSMGIQGFPTLKIFRPSSKPGGKPIIEDYQGHRTVKSITEAVVAQINNHVKRVSDKNLEKFLEGDKPKAILFSEKGTTSALLKSIAIDFLNVISVAQIRDKEKAAVERFDIKEFPTLVLLPGDGKDHITYGGELKKKQMVDFLSQAGQPNPDPAPISTSDKKKSSAKASGSEASSKVATDKAASDRQASAKKASDETADTESEEPSETPADTTEKKAASGRDAIPITTVTTKNVLVEKCLQPKSHTCVLVFVPSEASEQGDKVIASLTQLNTKYIHAKRHLFPFLSIPSNVEGTSSLRSALKFSSDVELVALNARRGWLRRYEGDFGIDSVEAWVDAIRMGDGKKDKLPENVVVEQAETGDQSSEEVAKETEATETSRESEPKPEKAAEAPEDQDKVKHEEL